MSNGIKCKNDEERRGLEMFLAGYEARGQTDQLRWDDHQRRGPSFKSLGWLILALVFFGTAQIGIMADTLFSELNLSIYPWWYFVPLLLPVWYFFSRFHKAEVCRDEARTERLNIEETKIIDEHFDRALVSIYRTEKEDA